MAKGTDIPKFGLLNGLKVLGCGVVTAEPYAVDMMAEHGADVIQIENVKAPERTRGNIPAFASENRNKRTLALNVPEGKEIFERLLKWADIWVESSKPGMYPKWGYTDEAGHAINPKLVIVHISGYGQTGDPNYVNRPGMDASGQAFSGIMSINGEAGGSPLVSKPGLSDYLTGLYASWAALAGVYYARETGKGDVIDVSQYEPLLRFQSPNIMLYLLKGIQTPRTGNANDTYAGINSYKCKDGAYVMIQVSGKNVIIAAAQMLGIADHPALAEGKSLLWGTEEAELMDNALANFCAEHTVEEVEAQMSAIKVTCSIVMDYAMMAKNPHIIARNDFIEWYDEHAGQNVKGVGVFPKVRDNPGQIWRGAPKFGQDSQDIMEELGFTAEEIDDLCEKQIIGKAK